MFQKTWFHRIIAAELEQWDTDPDSPNLLIMMPPRHGKSELVSRFLPAYLFGKDPNKRIIATSYAQDLANDMSRDCQHIMLTEAYARIFPNTRLSRTGRRTETARRMVSEFNIIGGSGYYVGRGIGGGITGRGADRIIIDDPVKNREDAESETKRETVWRWYTSTLRTRLQKNGKIVLLLTRWHEDDLAGRILKQAKNEPGGDKWKVVAFPAESEKSEYTHPEDMREDGDALWPDMYSEEYLHRTKTTLGIYDWSALFQQTPTPPGGAVCKREWLQVITKPPEGLTWLRAWDLAVSKKTSADHTASCQMAADEHGNVYIRGLIRMQDTWPRVRERLVDVARREEVLVGIEAQGTQKGFIDDLLEEKLLQQVAIMGYTVEVDKLTRALPWIARAQAGKFYIIDGSGVDCFINEAVHFTGKDDAEDDQVDAVSLGYRMLGELDVGVTCVGQYDY